MRSPIIYNNQRRLMIYRNFEYAPAIWSCFIVSGWNGAPSRVVHRNEIRPQLYFFCCLVRRQGSGSMRIFQLEKSI